MIKDNKKAFGIFVVAFVMFWNLAQFLYSTVFIKNAYHLEMSKSITEPLVLAALLGYLFFLRGANDINKMAEMIKGMDNAVLIDVRGVDEYRLGHIPGAINIPVEIIDGEIEKLVSDKDTQIYTYCLTGARSGRAVMTLRAMGYNNVRNIGGINRYKGEVVGE